MTTERYSGKILVVDDVRKNTELFARILASDGFDVVTANNGEEALAAVAAHLPDAVLLDVMMPGLDGFEVCRRIKESPDSRLVPVLLVTAAGA